MGPPLSSHGTPMGAQGVPLGAHGALWAPPELPWDSHGGPKGSHGPQRPKTFIFLRFSPPFSGQMCQNHKTVINFVASQNSEPDPPDPADPAETQHFGRTDPGFPTPGVRITVVYTNSLKLLHKEKQKQRFSLGFSRFEPKNNDFP